MLKTITAVMLLSTAAYAQITPKTGTYVAKDFKFSTGEVLPEVKLHYTTLGDPANEAVLILHGTTGSGTGMLGANFGGVLFGAGQPLDASKYFIILPDALGAGKSSKPSDGLKAKFPKYNYDDMVHAQHLVVKEALGVKRLRVIIGNSMGGMQTWMWGVKYPDYMDALIPMASQSTAMASRNWMMRRLIIDSIKNDPDYKNGDYIEQPKSVKFAGIFFGIGTNGGNLNMQKQAPTRELADKYLDTRMNAPFTADANNYLYQWYSSYDYNPSPQLGNIKAHVMAINSADDERNPPESGIMEGEIKRLKNAKMHLIPASDATLGHGTTGNARFWKEALTPFLASVPKK